MIFRRERWQGRDSCEKNSDKSLHCPQVELEGSRTYPLRRVPLHRSRRHNTLPWETGSFHSAKITNKTKTCAGEATAMKGDAGSSAVVAL